MKKVILKPTELKATIGIYSKKTEHWTHIDSPVYVDKNGTEYVKIYGNYFKTENVKSKSRTVDIYYEVVV